MFRFLSKPILTAHIKRAHIAPPEVCNYCGKEFKCKYYLKVHRNEAHMGIEIKRVQCNLCGVWMRENHLSKHVKFNHTQAEPSLICSICSKEVKNRVTMKSHMRNVHGNREHLCTVCGKTFSVSIGLKVSEGGTKPIVTSTVICQKFMIFRNTWQCTPVKICTNVDTVRKRSRRMLTCINIRRMLILTSGKRTVENA